jgi:predicted  nucleic acid-binding Zn-ribbon protein
MVLLGKKSAAVAEPSAPVAPAVPLSKLALAKAALAVADEAQRLIRTEIATLQERQRKTERELVEVDGNTGPADQAHDVGARLDRRMPLQQELAAIREMLPALNQRHRQADLKLSQARDEVKAVEHQIARQRAWIEDDPGRIRRQQRLVDEARGQLTGAENTLGNIERQSEARKAALIALVGAEAAN